MIRMKTSRTRSILLTMDDGRYYADCRGGGRNFYPRSSAGLAQICADARKGILVTVAAEPADQTADEAWEAPRRV